VAAEIEKGLAMKAKLDLDQGPAIQERKVSSLRGRRKRLRVPLH
jgi:hypothetical protein